MKLHGTLEHGRGIFSSIIREDLAPSGKGQVCLSGTGRP